MSYAVVLKTYTPNINFSSIQTSDPIQESSRLDVKHPPNAGDRSRSLVALAQPKLFSTACTFSYSKHWRNHIGKPLPQSRSVHMGNNLSYIIQD